MGKGLSTASLEDADEDFACGNTRKKVTRVSRTKSRRNDRIIHLPRFFTAMAGASIFSPKSFNFKVTDSMDNKISSNKNYGVIPLNLIHQILLYLQLTDYLNVVCSCSLFLKVGSTRLWWKEYYNCLFGNSLPNEEENKKINWKSRLFQSMGSDRQFKAIYKSVEGFRNGGTDEFKELNSRDSGIFRTKVVLVGEQKSGKTSLVWRLFMGNKKKFPERYEATIGAAFVQHIMFEKETEDVICLEIWDTAGQERYKSLAPMYYRGAETAIVTFGVDSRKQFERMKAWVKELQRQASPNCNIFVCGTRADKHEKREVDIAEIQSYVEERLGNNVRAYVECSALTGRNVFTLFALVAEYYGPVIQEEEDEEELLTH